MIELLCHEPGIYAVDAGYLRPQLAATYLLVEGGRVAVVDTATHACLPRVLDALRSLGLPPTRVDFVFLTHVHLDHAGGAGAMIQAFPEARLVVHSRGARHLADPAPLFAAVQAVYGATEARQLYGELLPVPTEALHALLDEYLARSGRLADADRAEARRGRRQWAGTVTTQLAEFGTRQAQKLC